MEVLGKDVVTCGLCGGLLEKNAVEAGCLNCLVLGGLKEAATPPMSARFQHYELVLREDNITPIELGRGAMGVTYRARDINLDAPVALKVISDRYAESAGARERFRREARAAAKLRHANVARVYHFGESNDEQCFYAMELVEGETLEEKVRREGPLPVPLVLEIALQITRALMAAEAQGLVHRDLKPSNVMLTNGDEAENVCVKVIDFGLARITDSLEPAGLGGVQFSGTPGFASPEQLTGAPLDGRSDIYSLGATLWFLLFGSSPEQARPAPTKIPPAVIGLLRRMLSFERDARPSARELSDRLQLCREAVEKKRHRWRFPVAAVAIPLLLAAGYYWVSRTPPPPPKKSIAVLPFEHLTKNGGDALLAVGMQDDLLMRLAQIKDLKVVSRESVMRYKPGRRDLRKIAQSLGVANILEGSVRRTGEQVVVNVDLVDTSTNQQLWAQSFHHKRADSIALQSELAAQIVSALRVTLTPDERYRLAKMQTTDAGAYEAYLRGVAAEDKGSDVAWLEEGVRAFAEAVRRDPKFSLAWAKLSILQSAIHNSSFDTSGSHMTEAKAALDKAGAVDSDAGYYYLARGYYHYWGEKNYGAARRDFVVALERLPNSADAVFALALLDRRLGRWEEAATLMARAAELNPHSSLIFYTRNVTLGCLRRNAEALALLDRRLQSEPDESVDVACAKALIYQNEGDLVASAKLLQPLPPEVNHWAQYSQLMQERRFPELVQFQKEAMQEANLSARERAANLDSLGWAQKHAGDEDAARATLREARDLLEGEGPRATDYQEIVNQLAAIYTGLDDKENALRMNERALQLLEHDMLNRPSAELGLAKTHAYFGDIDEVMRILPRLLRTPASFLTPALLRNCPIWDRIRSDPRFQKLVNDPAPELDLTIPPPPEATGEASTKSP